jgi:hypothetical protein
VYLSEDEEFESFSDESKLVWKETGIAYGDLKDNRVKDMQVDVPYVSFMSIGTIRQWTNRRLSLVIVLDRTTQWIMVRSYLLDWPW